MSLLTQGRLEPCKDNISGVKSFYLFYKDSGTTTTITNGYITDIKQNGGPISLSLFELKGKNSFTETTEKNNGLTFFNQELKVYLKGIDYLTNNKMKDFILRKDILIIVQLNNTKTILLGEQNGLFIEASTQQITTDTYDYTFSFIGKEYKPFNYLFNPTDTNPFNGLTTQPIILTDDNTFFINYLVMETFIALSAYTYNTIPLLEGDGYISDDNFYNIFAYLNVDSCATNKDLFSLTPEGMLVYDDS